MTQTVTVKMDGLIMEVLSVNNVITNVPLVLELPILVLVVVTQTELMMNTVIVELDGLMKVLLCVDNVTTNVLFVQELLLPVDHVLMPLTEFKIKDVDVLINSGMMEMKPVPTV